MVFNRFVFLCCCVSISTWMIAKADAPGVHLVRQSGTDKINTVDQQLSHRAKWSHGAYVFKNEIGGKPPVFYTLDRDGNWTHTAEFRNSEPVGFYSFDCDRETDGTIVFSGQTESAPRVVSPFLAWISADGQTQRMVRTDPYFPRRIAVAPDDTIWTLGYEMVNLDDKDPAVDQQANVLRHFDNRGKLIGSAFPQSGFDHYQRFRMSDGLLVATRERLGWYGPRSKYGSYTEISLAAMTMKEYPGPSSNSFADMLAMTNSGVPSLSVIEQPTSVRGNYVFSRDASRWVPVSVPPMGGFKLPPALVGNDGDNLVFKSGREAGFFSVSQ